MAGSFIDRTDPTFDDLGRREVINVRCKCGREVQIAPFRLIGHHGIAKHTKVWSLRDRFRCTKCKRRPPGAGLGGEVAGLRLMARKYDPLRDHLMALRSPSTVMTFVEIEELLGGSLPHSARSYRSWWANEPDIASRHVQCRAWQTAGFSAVVDLEAESVTFHRSGAS